MGKSDRTKVARDLVRTHLPAACRNGARSWVAGEWVERVGADQFETIDPTTGAPLIAVDAASAADIESSAAAGKTASAKWWARDGHDRASVFWQIARDIRINREALGTLDTLDAGRPIRDTTSRDVERAARIFEFFAGVTDCIRGAVIPVHPGFANRTQLEPHGVVGAIIPWNYPLTNAVTKIAPALATGNAVVLKPAEQTPLSALLLAEILHASGLPAGLLNVVNGPGEIAGEAIVASPGIGKIAFTGSTAVGRHIAGIAGRTLKSTTLELGGKSPCVVFDDADVETAAAAAVFSILSNQGQTCTAATRLIVSRKLVDPLLAAMTAIVRTIRVGDPMDPATLLGPLISQSQLERVQSYISLGEREGATVNRMEVDWHADGLGGFFVRPVFFSSVQSAMRISQEEIFGPVLSILPFDTDDEAIALANDTEFGLAGSVWTASLKRAERAAAEIAVGILWINTVHTLHPGSPYGGYGQSGIGLEMGLEAVNQFMKTKSIWTATERWTSPWAQYLATG